MTNLAKIRAWLEENCSDVSIMWKMRFKGQVKPEGKQYVICYNIQEAYVTTEF